MTTHYAGFETRYHPDDEINGGIIAEMIAAESFDLSVGYPPRRWRCPDCRTEHGRGHFGAFGVHRCLQCGHMGTGGIMFGSAVSR